MNIYNSTMLFIKAKHQRDAEMEKRRKHNGKRISE